jgi:hypothetical protein
MVDNLRKESYAKFAPKDENINIRKKIEDLQNKVRDLEEKTQN